VYEDYRMKITKVVNIRYCRLCGNIVNSFVLVIFVKV
jgi:hypothetical protein